MGWVGCYDLALYCDNKDCPDKWGMPHSYTEHQSMTHAIRDARNEGWKIVKFSEAQPVEGIGHTICPRCNGKAK